MPGLRIIELPEDARPGNPRDVVQVMSHIRKASLLGISFTQGTRRLFLQVSHMYTRPRPTYFLLPWAPDQEEATAYRAPEWMSVPAVLVHRDTLYVPRLEETETDARWKILRYTWKPSPDPVR